MAATYGSWRVGGRAVPALSSVTVGLTATRLGMPGFGHEEVPVGAQEPAGGPLFGVQVLSSTLSGERRLFHLVGEVCGLTGAQDGVFRSKNSLVGHEPLGGCFARRSLAAAAARASTASCRQRRRCRRFSQ